MTKMYTRREAKVIVKILLLTLVDFAITKFLSWLLATVDLLGLLKFVLFAVIVRNGVHLSDCVVAILLILWLLFD